jgi:hypothetical protein
VVFGLEDHHWRFSLPNIPTPCIQLQNFVGFTFGYGYGIGMCIIDGYYYSNMSVWREVQIIAEGQLTERQCVLRFAYQHIGPRMAYAVWLSLIPIVYVGAMQ